MKLSTNTILLGVMAIAGVYIYQQQQKKKALLAQASQEPASAEA